MMLRLLTMAMLVAFNLLLGFRYGNFSDAHLGFAIAFVLAVAALAFFMGCAFQEIVMIEALYGDELEEEDCDCPECGGPMGYTDPREEYDAHDRNRANTNYQG